MFDKLQREACMSERRIHQALIFTEDEREACMSERRIHQALIFTEDERLLKRQWHCSINLTSYTTGGII